MRNYEVTFIVDPVLSGDEIKTTAQAYVDHLQNGGCKIVHVDEMGLRQMTYPINRRTTGVFYCIEYEAPNGEIVGPMELAFRRDERIMRFLTVHLDKFGVKYNQDKRDGKIGKAKKIAKPVEEPKTVRREAKKPKPVVQQSQGDNLKRIEGIGPKVSEALKSAGISTFAKLAKMTPEEITSILDKDSDRFHNQDPGTWAKQAELAAAGEWDKLKAWQEDLKSEKIQSMSEKVEADQSEETAKSEETVTPEETVKSEETVTPEETVKSEEKVTPEATVESEATVVPEETAKSEETVNAEETIESETTVTPEETAKSEEKVTPEETVESEATVASEETDKSGEEEK